MRGARFRCAGAILVRGNEARDDRFKDIGLGGGERFERFTLWRGYSRCTFRCRTPLCGRWSRHCPQCWAGEGRDACRTDLPEHPAPRDIAERMVVLFVCHWLPSRQVKSSNPNPRSKGAPDTGPIR
jgi:hypothetical protein